MDVMSMFLILLFSVLTSGDPPHAKSYYFSTINPSEGILVDLADPTQIAETPFDFDKDTVFYVHGWRDEVQSVTSSGQKLKYIILQKHDVNVFLVDWSNISKNVLYPVVAQQVEEVGNALGESIWSLVENNGMSLARTTIIGYSLGAHVAGVAGRALDGAVGQVVGIDPAGLWFSRAKTSNRLTKSSARFVEVIHTCGGRLGFFDPLGHADYYPNGGREQQMCGTDGIGTCSQSMSLEFYSESLLSGKFKAKKCANYDSFKNGLCNGEEESWMGGYQLDKKANGRYFLDTNNFPPFAKDTMT